MEFLRALRERSGHEGKWSESHDVLNTNSNMTTQLLFKFYSTLMLKLTILLVLKLDNRVKCLQELIF
jgi:hypothetical protein